MKKETTLIVRFASIACFLSVVTTIGIHAFFNFNATTFEQRLLLFHDPVYIFNHWWVIVHCLLVIISMWGFCMVQSKKFLGFTGLGFVFFVVFGITEMYRQFLVIFYLNGMRQKYIAAKTEDIKLFLANSIENFGLLTYPLFGLFVFAFGIGNFFYGLSLVGEKGVSKFVSVLLLIWSAGIFLALGNEFWEWSWLSSFLPHFNLWYQSFMRALLGWWLWKMSSQVA